MSPWRSGSGPHRGLARIVTLFGAMLVTGSGCGLQDSGPRINSMRCPAPSGSAEPHLVATSDGVALSWMVHHEDGGHSFQFASWSPSSWSAVHTIRTGNDFFANWADRPSIVQLQDGTWVAHWLQKSAADTYAYDVHVARSSDGDDWSNTLLLHDDGTNSEHGFVSLVPDGEHGVVAVWLDGRETAGKPHDEGQMTLRAARWVPEGLLDQGLLDPRTCDCCPTTAVRTDRGVLVAYRDRSDSETRDISLVRLNGEEWSEPVPLHEDGWTLRGCPVNGPALAADGSRVAAAWYTEADGAKVNVALSEDAGETFGTLARVDDGHPAGRVDIVLLENGDALVVWLEAPPTGEAQIRARRVRQSGAIDPSFAVTSTDASRSSGVPQIVRHADTLYVAWTTADEPSRIQMATITNLD